MWLTRTHSSSFSTRRKLTADIDQLVVSPLAKARLRFIQDDEVRGEGLMFQPYLLESEPEILLELLELF